MTVAQHRRWLLLAGIAGLVMPYVALRLGVALSGTLPRGAIQALVPIVMVLPFYPLFLALVRRGAFAYALLAALAWALGATLCSVPLIAASGDAYAAVIWNGTPYRDDMFAWIRTGVGQEGAPRQFVPEHARHFAAFVLLSLLTLGFAGLCLGAALLNYMNFYVGSLFAAATAPGLLVAFSWPCYAVIRVAGFILAAIGVTAFALRTLRLGDASTRRIRLALWSGFALVLLDGVLKWLLAPHYREMLASATTRGG